MWSPRSVCAVLAAVAAVPIGVAAGPVPPDPFDGDTLFADLETYFEFGEHRGDTPESAEPATVELIARATATTLAAIEREGQSIPTDHAD